MVDSRQPEQTADQLTARLNALVEELEAYPDTEVREKALDLVQIILTLYGDAWRRALDIIETLPGKEQIQTRLFNDEVIRAMLLIHDLLPIELPDRVKAALKQLRPFLLSQGADIELLGIVEDRAHLRLIRSGRGAPPVNVLREMIEQALSEAAPDLAGIELVGLPDAAHSAAPPERPVITPITPAPAPPKLVQLKRPPAKAPPPGPWVALIRARDLAPGQWRAVEFGDLSVLVVNLDGEYYAYRNRCPAGERSLGDALVETSMLTCACHGYHYDLRRQGACLERPALRLDSLATRLEDDKVKVALA